MLLIQQQYDFTAWICSTTVHTSNKTSAIQSHQDTPTATQACPGRLEAYLPTTARSPFVGERFATRGLHDILHALAEGARLAFVGGFEAGESGSSSIGAADQPESNEGNDFGAHDGDEMRCAGQQDLSATRVL